MLTDIWFTTGYTFANFWFTPGLGWRGPGRTPLPKNKSRGPPGLPTSNYKVNTWLLPDKALSSELLFLGILVKMCDNFYSDIHTHVDTSHAFIY